MSILNKYSKYDELHGQMHQVTTYDNSEVLRLNAEQRASKIDGPQFRGKLAHAARIHMGDVARLYGLGYNLLSSDPDEVRRTLLYIQQNEPHLLTTNKKAFAKKRARWV